MAVGHNGRRTLRGPTDVDLDASTVGFTESNRY